MYHLHVVFYIQLTNWLLNSRLEDQYKEFFIQKVEEDVVDRDSSFFNDPANIDYKMWEYEIAADMLPSYIHRGLATKILTIGQTVLMFRNDSRLKKGLKLKTKQIQKTFFSICKFSKFTCLNNDIFCRFQKRYEQKFKRHRAINLGREGKNVFPKVAQPTSEANLPRLRFGASYTRDEIVR